MNTQDQAVGSIRISGSGTAPKWKAQGFTMSQLVHATVAELESNFADDLVAVRGASILGRDGYAEYAIFARSEKRLRPDRVKELILGTWGDEPLAEQIEELKQRREKTRGFFDLVEGMVVDEELAGIAGTSFLLMPDAHHDAESIEQAAAYLRRERDVVSMRFVRLEPYCPAALA